MKALVRLSWFGKDSGNSLRSICFLGLVVVYSGHSMQEGFFHISLLRKENHAANDRESAGC